MIEFCEVHGLVGQVVQIALQIIGAAGWFGAFGVVAIENVLPFIPSEIILPAIGFAAGAGVFGLEGYWAVVVAVIVTTLASAVGAIILFQISRAIGVDRVAKIPFVKKEGLQKAEDAFAKFGYFAVFFCRFIPVVRVLITIPAGLSDMKLKGFVLFTTLGSLIWNTVFVVIGYALGSNWCAIEPLFSRYSKAVVIVAVVVLALAIFAKKKIVNKK